MGLIRSLFPQFFSKDYKITLATASYDKARLQVLFTDSALNSVASLIGENLAKTEFRFYKKNHDEVRNEEWYKWNVRPNVNQTASEFKAEIAKRLVTEGEILIIRNLSGDLLIADSFSISRHANISNEFTNVTVEDYSFPGKYTQDDAIYMRLIDDNELSIIRGVYDGYAMIFTHAVDSYMKGYAKKMKVHIDASFSNQPNAQEKIDDLFEKQFRSFMNAGNAVIPEYQGMQINDLGSTEGTVPASDIVSIRNDMYKTVASTFRVPLPLFDGSEINKNNYNELINAFISNALQPIIDIIESAIDFALYKKNDVIKGACMKVDMSRVKHIDIFNVANAAEKLISTGTMSIDEFRPYINLEPINEDWSRTHYITKNYTTVNLMNSAGGDGGGTSVNENKKKKEEETDETEETEV